jgi:hypothetical protein
MTAEQRAEAAAAPVAEKVDKTQQAQLDAWGWPAAAGWGGSGAFGFPNMITFATMNCGAWNGTAYFAPWNTVACGTGFGGLGAGGW